MSALLKKEQLKWNKVISRARALMPTEYFQGFLINSINAEKVATASETFPLNTEYSLQGGVRNAGPMMSLCFDRHWNVKTATNLPTGRV